MAAVMKEQTFHGRSLEVSLWKRILHHLMEFKQTMIWLILANVVVAATDVALPMFSQYAINELVLNQGNDDQIVWFAFAYLLTVAVQCLSIYLFFRLAAYLEASFGKRLREKAFTKLQVLSFSYFDKTSNGWLMARVSGDISRLAEILSWSLIDIGWGLMVMIGVSIVMLSYNWKLACCIFVVVPVLAYASYYFQNKILKAHRETRVINSQLTASFVEGINGVKTTKTLGLEKDNFAEFAKLSEKMREKSVYATRINAMFQPVVYLLSAVAIALLLQIGGQQVLLETIQFGTLAMFIQYTGTFFDPLKGIARVMAELQMAQASAERVLSLLEETPSVVDSAEVIAKYGTILEAPKQDVKLMGNVRFDHVSFHYLQEEPVLEDFSLDVKAGEMVALVGETGSGKSTIVNLLCRFYEPINGQILIDGVDYRKRSLGWLHENIGYVLQTPTLFSGTVKENIRYGKLDASDEEIIAVAKLVNAHEFIMRMEHGYDTLIGQGGNRLSTGEKQLLSFARAILHDPAIMILDEATSSIDTQSEKMIQKAIEELLKGRTSFVVAHRLSTIVHADQIIVMKHGKVLEKGTHQTLMRQKGYYYELYTSQFMKEEQQRKLSELHMHS